MGNAPYLLSVPYDLVRLPLLQAKIRPGFKSWETATRPPFPENAHSYTFRAIGGCVVAPFAPANARDRVSMFGWETRQHCSCGTMGIGSNACRNATIESTCGSISIIRIRCRSPNASSLRELENRLANSTHSQHLDRSQRCGAEYASACCMRVVVLRTRAAELTPFEMTDTTRNRT